MTIALVGVVNLYYILLLSVWSNILGVVVMVNYHLMVFVGVVWLLLLYGCGLVNMGVNIIIKFNTILLSRWRAEAINSICAGPQ